MKFSLLLLFAALAANLYSHREAPSIAPPADSRGFLFIANQFEHTALVVHIDSRKVMSKTGVDINGHEVAVEPGHRFGYVPIYGNSGVGRPGTDGSTVEVVDLSAGRAARIIDLGKPVRPHCAKFGPDGTLYVSAELLNAIDAVDASTGKIQAAIPTGAPESHMFVISRDGHRAYTSNVGAGSVSVLDLQNHSLIKVIEVAKRVQRISISSDDRFVFTHDQDAPRIAVIDTATNQLARWIELPASVYSSAPTPDGRLLLANAPSGKLFVIDLSSGKIAASYPIPESIGAISIDRAGRYAYISCPQKGTVEVFDITGGKLEAPIVLTPGVDGLEWFPAIP